MGLYPSLDSSPLRLSASAFTTINDKVLMEMNERARKQLAASQISSATNPFSLGQPAPQAQKRFAGAHKQQFAQMDSLDNHPVMRAKRQQHNAESPAKRQRAADKAIPIDVSVPASAPPARRPPRPLGRPLSRPPSTPTTRLASTRTGPTGQPASARPEKPIAKLGSSRTSARFTPKVQPAQTAVARPAAGARPMAPADRPTCSPRATRPTLEPTPKALAKPVFKSTPNSVKAADARPASIPALDLPTVPTHIPSYARPTKATMKREVTRTRPPARIKQLLDTLPSVPKRR